MEVSTRRLMTWSGAAAALAAAGSLFASLLALLTADFPDKIGTQVQFVIHTGPILGGGLAVALTAAMAVVLLHLVEVDGETEAPPGRDGLLVKVGDGLAGLTALGLVLLGALALLVDLSELAIDKADRASGFTTGQVLAHLVMSVSIIVLAAVPLGGAARGLLRSGIALPTSSRSGTGYPQPQAQGYPQPQAQAYPQPQAYPPAQPPPQAYPPAQPPPQAYPPPTGRPLG